MTIYEYRCLKCGDTYESDSFDATLHANGICGGPLRRIYSFSSHFRMTRPMDQIVNVEGIKSQKETT